MFVSYMSFLRPSSAHSEKGELGSGTCEDFPKFPLLSMTVRTAKGHSQWGLLHTRGQVAVLTMAYTYIWAKPMSGLSFRIAR